jgi:hypothetical protein
MKMEFGVGGWSVPFMEKKIPDMIEIPIDSKGFTSI